MKDYLTVKKLKEILKDIPEDYKVTTTFDSQTAWQCLINKMEIDHTKKEILILDEM